MAMELVFNIRAESSLQYISLYTFFKMGAIGNGWCYGRPSPVLRLYQRCLILPPDIFFARKLLYLKSRISSQIYAVSLAIN
jgi:hypothetical protein